MGAPLYDITIYYSNRTLDEVLDKGFRELTNFVSELYYINLHGYKPPKTGRICLHLESQKQKLEPFYVGSICTCYSEIDYDKYFEKNNIGKCKYILEILHSSLINLSTKFNWNLEVFNQAHKLVLESEFEFEKLYPHKKTRNRKYSAQLIIRKTLEDSFLDLKIENGETSEIVRLIEKKNYSYYDSIYPIAKTMKWIDNTKFGILENENYFYYDVEFNKVINNSEFKETILYS